MEFGIASALVDGTLGNPLVLVAMLITTVLLAIPFALVAWRLSAPAQPRSTLLVWVGPAIVVVLLSRWLVAFVATVIFNIGTPQHFSLCFMPTWHPVRDWGPSVLALGLAAAIAWWRRSRAARADGVSGRAPR